MRFLAGLLMFMITSACASRAPAALTPAPAPAPVDGVLTRAERTGWLETSSYEDVIAFIDSVAAAPLMHATAFGSSLQGRALPLVVVGAASAEPSDVRASGHTRVLVFANIHAGEVEGKEAAQILLRELAAGEHRAWTDSLVLLIAPIYNADGNERISLDHRSDQHGPFAGVGTRENAQGLDLNRDHMKLESPEARSLVWLMTEYDPHVVVDLHTTNGTHHAYHLTYSPPLHPATDGTIVGILRERWLPGVTRAMERRGWLTWYYGNLPIPEWGMTGERGWYTFDYRARFNNSYAGLRNRFGILSEAYSYASFEDRVRATHAFVEEVLDWAAAHAWEIRATTAAADAQDLIGRSLPLRAALASSGGTTILLGEVEERVNPLSGERYLARLDSVRPERMPNYDRFATTEAGTVPGAYLLPDTLVVVLDLLRAHGVRLRPSEALGDEASGRLGLEEFRIDSMRVAERAFQGHHEREVFGEWRPIRAEVPAGGWWVPMDQPLARLVFALLEPRAPDGVVNWNLVDEQLEADPGRYPIRRALARAAAID